MAESDELYRSACQRIHRVLGNFLALFAWCEGADCVILDRVVLEKLFDLKQLRDVRIEWLRADVTGWFRHSEVFNFHNKDSVESLCFSRKPIRKIWVVDSRTNEERKNSLIRNGIQTILFDEKNQGAWKEESILRQLTSLAVGLSEPNPSTVNGSLAK